MKLDMQLLLIAVSIIGAFLFIVLLLQAYRETCMYNDIGINSNKWRCIEYLGNKTSENCVLYRKEQL